MEVIFEELLAIYFAEHSACGIHKGLVAVEEFVSHKVSINITILLARFTFGVRVHPLSASPTPCLYKVWMSLEVCQSVVCLHGTTHTAKPLLYIEYPPPRSRLAHT